MVNLRKIIVERVEDAINDIEFDCPDCEGFYDDDQYTCTTCWCEGGNGKLRISDYIIIKE